MNCLRLKMFKTWHDDAWEDYLYWQKQDKKMLNKINRLVRDIERSCNVSMGGGETM